MGRQEIRRPWRRPFRFFDKATRRPFLTTPPATNNIRSSYEALKTTGGQGRPGAFKGDGRNSRQGIEGSLTSRLW